MQNACSPRRTDPNWSSTPHKLGPTTCRQYWLYCIPHMLPLLPCPSTKCRWAVFPSSGDEDVGGFLSRFFCALHASWSMPTIWGDVCLLVMGFRNFWAYIWHPRLSPSSVSHENASCYRCNRDLRCQLHYQLVCAPGTRGWSSPQLLEQAENSCCSAKCQSHTMSSHAQRKYHKDSQQNVP